MDICDPTIAGLCSPGSGCAAELSPSGVYLGYGFCHLIDASQPAAGQSCTGSLTCQASATCVPDVPKLGESLCAAWSDPFAAGGCGSGSCALSVTPGDAYAYIGVCLPNPPDGRTLGESCSGSPCDYPGYCAALPDGELVCQLLCDPWAPTCPASTGCLPLLTMEDDFHGAGVCGPVVPNAVGEFSACDLTVQNCAAGLVCLPVGFGGSGQCIQYCDPLNPATCPSAQTCIAVADSVSQYSGVGICNDQYGAKHSEDSCVVFADCLTGDCYFSHRTTGTGTCIQACELGALTSCPGGKCADGGFGNGLGYCVLADGGRWD